MKPKEIGALTEVVLLAEKYSDTEIDPSMSKVLPTEDSTGKDDKARSIFKMGKKNGTLESQC